MTGCSPSDGSHGVTVSTLDSESSDPSSNLGGTSAAQLLLGDTSYPYVIVFFSNFESFSYTEFPIILIPSRSKNTQ